MSPETDPIDIDDLAMALERQGVACLRAWSQRQPKPIALRMELGLAPGLAPSDDQLRVGPVIVETFVVEIGRMSASLPHSRFVLRREPCAPATKRAMWCRMPISKPS